MVEFYVNEKMYRASGDEPLLRYLRDTLRLTSVKDGCSEGACGTCTVLIEGKAQKACVQKITRLEGKHIITCEGLSKREREVYAYAFSVAGAVQCGFCIPGMVMCAKGLIDNNAAPTKTEVRHAIRNNICRCTGYKKIEDAILLAAELFQNGNPVPLCECKGLVGENTIRIDAGSKAIGDAVYCDDIYMDGMLYGSAVRSRYPRARILSIRTDKAKALPGVVAVLTAADVPGVKKLGHLKKDYDVMIPAGSITHFLGDAVAIIAADTRETLEQAKSLVEVEYELLQPITSPKEALLENAPSVHEGIDNILSAEHLIRGDAEQAIARSKYSVTRTYHLPFTDHAFMEPESAVALRDGDTVHIFSSDQGIYQTRKECAEMLGLPQEKVRVSAMMVGGGFGGKEDMSVQHHATLLAWHTGRPVKVTFSRAESLLVHPKRHAMEIEMTTACDEKGYLTGMKAVIISDTGAYASLGGPVLQRACTHAAGPYNYQNIDIIGKAVYTNNPPGGAFRGFGVTQSCFAAECNINLLAEACGMSPFAFRYQNAIRPGQVLPNGQIADDSTALAECLDALRAAYEQDPNCGIACAMKNTGLGTGIPDIGRCILRVKEGKVFVYSSAACIGQGLGTIMVQMVCQTAGLHSSLVQYCVPDTAFAPNSGNTTASRQTVFTGEATRRAAESLHDALKEAGSLEELDGQEFSGEFSAETDSLRSEKPNPVSHIAYGYAAHLVQLNNDGSIRKVVAAHDVGRAINPLNVQGQIDGGVAMCLGYALTEDFPLDHCNPTAKLGTLGLLRANSVPEIDAILIEKPMSDPAYGAKGIGEISSIPTAPAVQLAYYMRDGKFRTKLPLESTFYRK